MEVLLKYLTVYGLSAFKFIFGPTLGLAYGFSVLETILVTVLGMMTTVYTFTYFGQSMRHWMVERSRRKKKKVFTKRNRQYVQVWKKYGVKGIAFLTPLLLMPVGGALLANLLGGERREIILWMWISAIFWAVLEVFALFYAYDLVVTLPFIKNLDILN